MPSDYEAFRPELCYLKQSLESAYATGSLAGSRIPVEQQSRAEQIALLSYTRCYKTLRNQRLNMPDQSHERPSQTFKQPLGSKPS